MPVPQRRSFRSLLTIAAAVAAIVALSYWFRPLFVAFASLLAGILLAILLDAPIGWLRQRLRIHRNLAVGIVIFVALVVLGGFLWAVGPPFASQLSQLAARMPDAVEAVRGFLVQFEWGKNIVALLPEVSRFGEFAPQIIGGISQAFSSTIESIVGTLVALFIGAYLVVDPKLYIEGALKLFRSDRRARMREVLAGMNRALRWWLVGRFASMILVGALTIAALLVMGVPLALGLGLLAGLLGLIPYVGPILAALPAILIAVSQTPILALYVVIVYTGIQVVENYLITPIVQRKLVRLAPVVVIVAQVILGLTFGLIGALLATPIAIIVIVAVQMLHVEDELGDTVRILGTTGHESTGTTP